MNQVLERPHKPLDRFDFDPGMLEKHEKHFTRAT